LHKTILKKTFLWYNFMKLSQLDQEVVTIQNTKKTKKKIKKIPA